MKERVAAFGPNDGIVGIVTMPSVGTAKRAVLMANVGTHHRVGPCRLYVELARSFASQGWHALRFDLSGMGDSVARVGKGTDVDHAVLDVVDAMNLLESQYGIREFVALGLCSGVDCMHAVSVQDPRIIGAIFIDGYTYPTVAFFWRRHVKRLFRLTRWKRSISRRLAFAASYISERRANDLEVFDRQYPTRARFSEEVIRMTDRGVRILFLFTGSVDYRLNDPRQVYEVIGDRAARAQLDVEYFQTVDHLFSSEAKRTALLDRLSRWLGTFTAPIVRAR